jgi:hypothetical protein
MTIICCAVCQSDPIGRWKQPPAMVFVDAYRSNNRDGDKYVCRDHLSAKREAEIATREKALGWNTGGLR